MLLNGYKVISKNLAVWGILFCMLFFAGLQVKAAKEQMPDNYEEVLQAKNLASGVDNGCKWSIDTVGKLTIRSVESGSNLRNDAWRWYRDKITSVDIDVPYSDNLYRIFEGFTNLRTAKVKIDRCIGNAACMFAECDQLEKLDLSHLNTNGISDMGYMFKECKSLERLDLSHADVKNLRSTEGMFSECEKIKSIKIVGWDARNLMDTSNMFSHCSSLVELDLRGWKTQRLMDMSYMFYYCSSLKTLDLNMMKTAKVRNMDSMFYNCSSLVSLNLKHFNTQKVKSMRSMFCGCSTLRSLDLSSFHLTSYREDDTSLFLACDNLETVMVPCDLSHQFILTGFWYRDDTMQAISCLPINLTHSIQIHKQVNGNPFLDVRTTQWQYENVKFVFDKGIMRGKEKINNRHYIFDADAAMTRAEFVQTLYNHSGKKFNTYKKIFSDVPKEKWYTNAILWAYDQKLVSGVGNKRFGVNDKITRQDMITILYKYAEKSNKKYVKGASKFSISSYTDSKNVVSYAVLPMKWATGNKIMNGKPASKNKYTLDPKGNATRAECAAVMKNYMTYIEKIKG